MGRGGGRGRGARKSASPGEAGTGAPVALVFSPPTGMAFPSCFSLPWTWWRVLWDGLSRVPFMVIWLPGSRGCLGSIPCVCFWLSLTGVEDRKQRSRGPWWPRGLAPLCPGLLAICRTSHWTPFLMCLWGPMGREGETSSPKEVWGGSHGPMSLTGPSCSGFQLICLGRGGGERRGVVPQRYTGALRA